MSVAEGVAVFALVDRQQIVSVDPGNGKERWRATVDGRVDTSPTISGGLVYAGTRNGWVYALNRESGKLVWRFFAAPRREMMLAFGQLESRWPLHGSILVDGGGVWAIAGRHNDADGGLWWWRLDPVTGEPTASGRLGSDDLSTEVGVQRRSDGKPSGANTPAVSDGRLLFLAGIYLEKRGDMLVGIDIRRGEGSRGEHSWWADNFKYDVLIPGNQGLVFDYTQMGGYKMPYYGFTQAAVYAYKGRDFLHAGGTTTEQHRGGHRGGRRTTVTRFRKFEKLREVPHPRQENRRMKLGAEVLWAAPYHESDGTGLGGLAVAGLRHDDTDDLMISAKQWLARDFSRKISEQLMRSVITLSGRAARGGRSFYPGGHPPYGYDMAYLDSYDKPYMVVRRMADGSRQILSPDGAVMRTVPRGAGIGGTEHLHRQYVLSSAERVETVRRIFRLRVEERLGPAATARWLNQLAQEGRGPRSPTGGSWRQSSVIGILGNPAYMGHSVSNKTSQGVFYRIRRGVVVPQSPWSRRTYKRNPRDDWIVVAGTHEAIVDDQLFTSAQQFLKPDHVHSDSKNQIRLSRYIFAGKLRCCACGRTFLGSRTRRRRLPGRLGYSCGGHKTHGKSYCRYTYVREGAIEKEVVRALARMLARLKVATGTVDGRPYRREQPDPESPGERRRERLAAELVRLEQLPQTWHFADDGAPALLKAFVLRWMGASLVEKRDILYLLVERIDFDPDTRTARVWFSDTVRRSLGGTDVSETFPLRKLLKNSPTPTVADLLDRDHGHV